MANQQVDIPETINNTGSGYSEVLMGDLGVDTDPSFSYLLGMFPGASLGVSVRKINGAYSGPCMKVRRSSDNSELDIGFVDNELDQASIVSHVGAGDGFVTTWYDQSGNGNDMVQTTASNQPQIASSGVVNVINSMPAMLFDGSNDEFDMTSGLSINISWSAFQVGKRAAPATMGVLLSNASAGAAFTTMEYTDGNVYVNTGGNSYVTTSVDGSITQKLFSCVYNGSGGFIWKNDSSLTLTSFGYGSAGMFSKFGNREGLFANAYSQEYVFYPTDQTSNVSAINNQINAYFIVY